MLLERRLRGGPLAERRRGSDRRGGRATLSRWSRSRWRPTVDQRTGIEPIGDALRTRRSAEQALLGADLVPPRQGAPGGARPRVLSARSDDLAVVERALKILDLDPAELHAAEDAGLISLEKGQIGFTHGLVRSTVAYGALRLERRRGLTRRWRRPLTRAPSLMRSPGTERWPPRRPTSSSQPRSRGRPTPRQEDGPTRALPAPTSTPRV